MPCAKRSISKLSNSLQPSADGITKIFKKLKSLCDEIQQLHPFTHRTTVQRMLNGHTKESSDRLLGQSFQQAMDELEAVGYKPPEVVINQDPHFAEFNPSFKNGEIR